MPGGDSTVISRIGGVMTSVAVKAPVAAVAITPIQLKGLQTINGVALAATIPPTRCLVTAQADSTTNGIYDVSTTGWLRSTDFDGAYDAVQGTLVVVNALGVPPAAYQLTTANPVLFGTSAILFIPIGAAFPGLGSLVVALSNTAIAGNFTLAVATAAAIGGSVLIDRAGFLTADTSIPTAVGSITSIGAGPITGTHNITFNHTPLNAGGKQVFNLSGGGAVLGTILAEAINALWWWDGSNDAAALQASLTYVNQSAARNAKVDWTGRAAWTVTANLVSTGGDQPQILGSNAGIAHSISPDSTNIVASGLTTGTSILKIVGATSPCGGSVQGLYFDSAPGAGLTAVEVDNAVGMLLRNSCSPNIARMNYLHNTSSEFTENTILRDVIAGLGPTAIYLELSVAGGTNSFSGLDIDIDVSLNSGDRTGFPLIKADTGTFPYNGRLSLFIHNNGASNVILLSKAASTPPWWFADGALRLEGADARPIVVNDPAGAPLYYGGTGPFVQGMTFNKSVVDISNVLYCDAFAYQPSGVVITKGGRLYQQVISFNGASGVELACILNPTFAHVTGKITGPTYGVTFSTDFAVDQSGGVNGAKGNDLISIATDGSSYGGPTIAMNSNKRVNLSNGSWPSGSNNFTVTFQIEQHGD